MARGVAVLIHTKNKQLGTPIIKTVLYQGPGRHLLGKQGRDALHERFDGAREAQVRVDAAHLGGEVDKLELAIARGDSPLVGLESLPEAMRTSVGAVVSPCVVVFASVPEVSVRQDAWRAWPEAPLAQSAWADYVFKKQFLFDRARPVVLAAPGEGADERYLEHAAAAGAARG